MSDRETTRWTRRKAVFPFHFSAEGGTILVTAEITNRPRALSRFLSRIEGTLTLIGTTTYSKGDDLIVFSGIGRIIGSRSTESLEKQIARNADVKWFELVKSRRGLLVDRFHTGFQAGGGEPALLLPTAVLASTFDAVVHEFGTGGETVLYRQGEAYSKARWAVLKRVFGSHPEARLGEVAELVGSVGWAVVSIEHEPGSSTIVFENHECFECSGLSKRGRGCPFLRGMAVGLAEAVYGVEMTSKEVKCRKKGDDACVFVVRTKDGGPLE